MAFAVVAMAAPVAQAQSPSQTLAPSPTQAQSQTQTQTQAQSQVQGDAARDAKVRALYAQAHDAFSRRDYATARAALQQVEVLSPSPVIRCNIGQVESASHDYKSALRDYEECLSKAGSSLDADSRRRIEADRDRLRQPSTLSVEASVSNAEVFVDDGLLGNTPLAAHSIAAGDHMLMVRRAQYAPHRQQFTIEPGENKPIRVELTPLEPPPRPTLVWPWVVTGVLAVGGAVTGTAALISSHSQSNRLTTYPTTHDDLASGANRVKAWSIVSEGLFAAAAVAACVGIWLTLDPPRTAHDERTAQRPQLSLGIGAAKLDAKLTF